VIIQLSQAKRCCQDFCRPWPKTAKWYHVFFSSLSFLFHHGKIRSLVHDSYRLVASEPRPGKYNVSDAACGGLMKWDPASETE
jgi:hypothetical protein